MMNIKLINKAVNRAINYCESRYISQDTNSLKERVVYWYSISDITDPEILAALALEFEVKPKCCLFLNNIKEITVKYFPEHMFI